MPKPVPVALTTWPMRDKSRFLWFSADVSGGSGFGSRSVLASDLECPRNRDLIHCGEGAGFRDRDYRSIREAGMVVSSLCCAQFSRQPLGLENANNPNTVIAIATNKTIQARDLCCSSLMPLFQRR
jgi:hypothetical protein